MVGSSFQRCFSRRTSKVVLVCASNGIQDGWGVIFLTRTEGRGDVRKSFELCSSKRTVRDER